ncbi:Cytochrome b [Geodia barretti]|uniref:Cytochrome b n=1 Tax=Geodia barretti TaxID=519541 RepID=A0AA35SJ30_GEOBA|nr:Cytochrome b [Geodia barretti]
MDSGVLLLLVVLGFGFTGYLLPWDEKAYWGTVVGVEIASTAPVLGDFVAKVMRGGTEIGTVTLVRHPTEHPRRDAFSSVEGGKPFYPDQVFEDVVGMLILFVILAAVALFVPVPLDDVADPTNASYDPRPEWYFLFLFQLLKYFQGPLEIVGTFVIPTVGILLLLFLPFLDRSARAVLWKRPVALTVTTVCVAAIAGLTFLGVSSPKLETEETPQPTEQTQSTAPSDTETGEVEEGEEAFDFQLTEEEIEGTEEGEEVFDFQLTEEELQ